LGNAQNFPEKTIKVQVKKQNYKASYITEFYSCNAIVSTVTVFGYLSV